MNVRRVVLLFLILCGVLLVLEFPAVLAVVYAAPAAWLVDACIRWSTAAYQWVRQWVRDRWKWLVRCAQVLAFLGIIFLCRWAGLSRLVSVLAPILAAVAFLLWRRVRGGGSHTEEASPSAATVMLLHPDGRFENVEIPHQEGDGVWCASCDGEGQAMAYHPVTLRDGAGYTTLEDGTKKAKLFKWDGGEAAPEPLGEADFPDPEPEAETLDEEKEEDS